jgi:hypothetical protein
MTTAPADRDARTAAPSRPVSRRIRLAVALTAGGVVALATVGFLAAPTVLDALHKQHRETFGTRAEAAAGWKGVDLPAWIPDDATNLRNLATTDETVSVIRVDSAAHQPTGCTTGARHGMVTLTADWVPNPPPMTDTVWKCGSYEVAKVSGGWLGWYQAQEPGQKPAAS